VALLIKTKFMTVQPPPKVSYTLHDAEADGVSTARVIRVSAVSLCHALVEFFPYDRVYDRRERMVCGATRQVEWDDLCLLTTYSPNNGRTTESILGNERTYANARGVRQGSVGGPMKWVVFMK
jgi:hypothetical protein